jgi:hypothetical protein
MNDNCQRLEVDGYCDASAMAAWKKHADDCVACAGKIRLYETLVNGARSTRKALKAEQRDAVLLAAANRTTDRSAWKTLIPVAAGIIVAIGLILLWPSGKTPAMDNQPTTVRKVVKKDRDLAWNHREIKQSRKRMRLVTMVTSANDKAKELVGLKGLKRRVERRKKYFGKHWTEL